MKPRLEPLAEAHPLSAHLAFPLLKGVIALLFLGFGAVISVIGRRNLPRKGGILILSNHQSNTDPLVVQYASRRLIHFMTRRELFSAPGIGAVVKWWRAFPISQRRADREGIKKAVELGRAGHAVGVFPEGELSPDGNLLEILPGVALVIRMAQIPVICVGLHNTRRLMPDPDTKPRWAGCVIRATWGQIHTFAPDASSEEMISWITNELTRLKDGG